jgi:hypothetical protein
VMKDVRRAGLEVVGETCVLDLLQRLETCDAPPAAGTT